MIGNNQKHSEICSLIRRMFGAFACYNHFSKIEIWLVVEFKKHVLFCLRLNSLMYSYLIVDNYIETQRAMIF